MSTLEEPLETAAAALSSAASSYARAASLPVATAAPAAPPPVDFADPKNAVIAARAVLGGADPEPSQIDAVVTTAQGLASGAAAAGSTPAPVPMAIPPIVLKGSGPNVLPVKARSRMATGMFWLAGVSAAGAVLTELIGGPSGDRASLFLVILAMISVVAAYLTTMGFGTFSVTAGPQNVGQGGNSKEGQN